MDLDKHEIKEHVKRRRKEKQGRFLGLQMLDGTKIFGTLEESKPNILLVKDSEDNQVKDIHRALIKRFMLVVDGNGGANGKEYGKHGGAGTDSKGPREQ